MQSKKSKPDPASTLPKIAAVKRWVRKQEGRKKTGRKTVGNKGEEESNRVKAWGSRQKRKTHRS